MLKYAVAFVLALLPTLALADANVCLNASGGACGAAVTGTNITTTGYNPSTGGALFVVPAASLQSGSLLTLSYDVKTTSFNTSTTSLILDTRPSGGSTGFTSFLSFTENNDFIYMFTVSPAGFNHGSSYCRGNNGHTCFRTSYVNDGAWHHVCSVFAGMTNTFTMVDGVVRDFNDGSQAVSLLGFTPSTSFWQLGNFGVNNFAIREMQSKQTAATQADCATLYQYHLQGKRPTTGPLSTGWSIWLPFDNCNGSGCADISGNSNNAIYDNTPPSCSVTSPTGTVSGTVNLQGTCTDAVGISSVTWYVDNVRIGSSTTSPFTTSLVTTNYSDGSHTISMIAINAGSAQSTATGTFTSSNSISAKTVFLDPTSGTDCPTNTGLSSGSPCSTFTGVMSIINSNPLHGGDSILLQHGTTLNLTSITASTVLILNGPSSTLGSQNAFPGATITIGTYGGSGNCHVLAGTTTDCASVVFSANGTTTQWMAMVNIVNVPNVTVQNLVLKGQQANGLTCPVGVVASNICNIGIRNVVAGNYNTGFLNTGLITNNEILGFTEQIYIAGITDPQFSSAGTNCGVTASDNYLDNSSATVTTSGGIFFQAMCNSGASQSNYVGSTGNANYINNTGGNAPPNGDGSAIVWTGAGFNLVDTNNVTLNTASNDQECGSGYPNWWFAMGSTGTSFNLVEGNESGIVFPTVAAGCDKGQFDLDFGTGNFKMFWNYGHESYGPAVNVLIGTESGILSRNNTISYNIFENSNSASTGGGGMIAMGSSTYFHVNNNNFWDGYSGTTVPPTSSVTNVADLSIESCSGTVPSLVANNIFVANSNSTFPPHAAWFFDTNLTSCLGTTFTFAANDYWPVGNNTSSLLWKGNGGTIITTLVGWNAASGDTGINVNPNFASPGGGGSVQCYSALSGIPVQPGSTPCPAGYELNNNTNALIGVGTNYTATITTSAANDYFTNSIPNGVGTGYNIGADGGHH